jgi:hypothetical protein
MKLLFVQLPLTDHGQNYTAGNQQSASASLCGFVRTHFTDVAAEYLPSPAANILSDRMTASYIVKKSPDILCMPTYLWNAERNLLIAARVKAANPSILVIFGGPEIQTDSFLMDEKRNNVDIFFSGEGEWFFSRYLSGEGLASYTETIRGNTFITQTGLPADISDCPEPFTHSMIESSADGSVFVEMTRGCPYKCCYCNYSKNSPTVRERGFSILLSAIDLAQKRGISGIYILAPTFDASGSLNSKLESLARVNRSVALHTEVRTDRITKETARLMKKAGFESLEIGLQTLTPSALTKIGRKGDTERQIRGIHHLLNEGLDLKVGIIAGLPGDTISEFTGTIDRLQAEGLGETIELYPLMVLPGTRIRQMADEEQISFQRKPPYLFLESPGFSHQDILSVRHYIEETTGFASAVHSLPDFCSGDAGFIRGLDTDAAADYPELDLFVETNLFTLFLRGCTTGHLVRWIDRAHTIQQSSLVQIAAYADESLFDEWAVLAALEKHKTDSFHSRLHIYDDPRHAHRVQINHVIGTAALFDMAAGLYTVITPILLIRSAADARHAAEPSPAAVLVGKGAYRTIAGELKVYAEYTDLINFEDRSDMERFCSDNDLDCPEPAHTRIYSAADSLIR